MEEFEVKALQSAPHPPHLWVRFVDGTLVIQKAKHSQHLLHHISSQDPNILFMLEEPAADSSVPFLHTMVTPGPNNTIHTNVYRKPTHTDHYLHWGSNHFITAKNSVYNTLAHKAKVVFSIPEDLTKELDHLKKALMACRFPNWVLNRLQQQFQLKHKQNSITNQTEAQSDNNNNTNNNHNKQNKNISIVILYIQGLGEEFKRTCNIQGIQAHFKGTTQSNFCSWLPKLTKSGVIYRYKCPNINCTKQCIGESGRTLGDRYKECLKAPSPIHLHTSSTGHPVSPECFSIMDRESHGLARNIKEAMYIRVNDPSLNRNLGKFQLPHVWDQVLKDTHSLHLKLCKSPPPLRHPFPPWTLPTTPSTQHKGGGTHFYR